jgi:DNA-binding NarL/FixJ family response regulator
VIRVVVADDHAIVRAGVRSLLEREADVRIVAEAEDGRAAVEQVEKHRPEVLLIDLSMPGSNGVEAITRVRKLAPTTRVLVLSMHAAPEYVRPALRAGAHGYVVKGSGLDDLVSAVRAIAAGERFLDAKANEVALTDELSPGAMTDDLDRITPREREVLQLVAEGHTNREISEALGISPKTVDTHRMSVMRKLGIHDAQALTRFALRRGLISPE